MWRIKWSGIVALVFFAAPSFAQETGVCIDAGGGIVKVCPEGASCDTIKGYQSISYTDVAAGQTYKVYEREKLVGKYKLVGTVQAQEGQQLAWYVGDGLNSESWDKCINKPQS